MGKGLLRYTYLGEGGGGPAFKLHKVRRRKRKRKRRQKWDFLPCCVWLVRYRFSPPSSAPLPTPQKENGQTQTLLPRWRFLLSLSFLFRRRRLSSSLTAKSGHRTPAFRQKGENEEQSRDRAEGNSPKIAKRSRGWKNCRCE